ncbi:unnamed protein product [Prunus armeniaca]
MPISRQGSQHDFTQDAEHTQPNKPEHSHHSALVNSRLNKDKGPLHPETTKSRLIHISSPKDWPYEPMKVYRDCRDRLLDCQRDPINILVNLQDSRVTHPGPPLTPTHLPVREGAGDSND